MFCSFGLPLAFGYLQSDTNTVNERSEFGTNLLKPADFLNRERAKTMSYFYCRKSMKSMDETIMKTLHLHNTSGRPRMP